MLELHLTKIFITKIILDVIYCILSKDKYFQGREKCLLERMFPGEKPHRKNAFPTFCISEIPPMKLNQQH